MKFPITSGKSTENVETAKDKIYNNTEISAGSTWKNFFCLVRHPLVFMSMLLQFSVQYVQSVSSNSCFIHHYGAQSFSVKMCGDEI